MKCLIGLDDTDSSRGGCTTHLAYRIAVDLRSVMTVLPYPRLVRLNPNVPFKTRGNAAVCLTVETDEPRAAFRAVSEKVAGLADEANGANSGLVLLQGGRPDPRLIRLYRDALTGVVNVHRARRLLASLGAMTMTLGNGMGLVGAASSLGFDGRDDHTFELISYRKKDAWGEARSIDPRSVEKMDKDTFPHTFNSFDYQKRRVMVAPHGPDPVFAGVRGDSARAVVEAFGSLEFDEKLEGWMVYMTNQHTDAHLQGRLNWKSYSSGWAQGRVAGVATGRGGHVYLSLASSDGPHSCAFYEPTGDLRRAAMRLMPGDRVRVFGGVRRPSEGHSKVLNAEALRVLSAPGRSRGIVRGTYVSSTRAHRHLTRPLARYGREAPRSAAVIRQWISVAG